MTRKYYKAFNRDLQCRGMQYEEGETYEVEGKLELCSNGLHFCKDLVLTLEYYPIERSITDNKYAEVEVLGDVVWEEPTHHKGCTNKLKIVRVIPDDEVFAIVDEQNNSGDGNSGYGNSGYGNSGDWNSGYGNSGYGNSGYGNSGYGNSGNRNSGYGNSGNRNSGDGNSGYGNSGNRNSGNRNSGYGNSGYGNSGNGNSGNRNSGDWNSCDNESGAFNTIPAETIRVFNRPCPVDDWDNAYKPGFLYFEVDPELGYKGSFQKSWDEADEEDRQRICNLPNFDPDVFFELSGIRVDEGASDDSD